MFMIILRIFIHLYQIKMVIRSILADLIATDRKSQRHQKSQHWLDRLLNFNNVSFIIIQMFSKALPRVSRLLKPNQYRILDHNKMEKMKDQIYGDNKRTLSLKLKFILKETKYTIVQGTKDLWEDAKWMTHLYRTKTRSQFTGYELSQSNRIIADVLKFIPYSVLLAIPLAEVLIPVLIWIFPNAIPSFFLFDTAEDKRKQALQVLQQESHKILLQRFLGVLRQLSKRQQQFTHYDEFKSDFFEIIDDLNTKLDYRNFNSDELIQVLRFLGGDFITGTRTVNKIANLFTMDIPRIIIKICRFFYEKMTRKKLQPYEDPFFIVGNFKVFQFNYFPFEYLKRKFLLYQISRKYKILKRQDQAFEKYGMDDIQGNSIKDFARERGFATLSCYITLKNVLKNDWVKMTTHPKFEDKNIKLWYSVMMYNFLAQTNKDLN